MTWTKRIAPIAVAAAVGAGGLTLPALAASSTHWSKTKCKSYEKAYLKKHPSPSKAQARAANKVLKAHGCALRVHGK